MVALGSCGDQGGGGDGNGLTGMVKVDGSSTVAPISTVAAELFRKEHPRVQVTVGISGTGGGFKKFLDERPELRTDINDASRAIKPAEIERAARLGVEFIELPIAKDGIAVVVNPGNTFCDYLTVKELKLIWEPGSKITNWKEIRDGFPDLPLKLYGPGTDSGTFDYFTEAIVGKEKASRSDFTMSEDDNVLVQGVEGNTGALGYFGYSYYEANRDQLKLLGIGPNAQSAVRPTISNIREGRYQPLSRPLFLYINKASLQSPAVRRFVDFYLENAGWIVEHPKVNYVALTPEAYKLVAQRLGKGVAGSVMAATKHTGPVDVVKMYGPTSRPASR